MYKYRDYNGSSRHTRKVMERILAKVGEVVSVRGYRYIGRYFALHEAVLVRGTKGTARFNGVNWGYHGEGPRTLIQLLRLVGMSESMSQHIAFNSCRKDEVGTDWKAEFTAFKAIA